MSITKAAKVPTWFFMLALLLFLAGCAYHSVPPKDYSQRPAKPDRVVRIVFDQNGNIYPPSQNAYGLPIPKQPENRNIAFDLGKTYQRLGLPYPQDRIYQEFANAIAAEIAAVKADRVVFLIKGFNNSFKSSLNDFANTRAHIRERHPRHDLVYVEVYWDALFQKLDTSPLPLFWFKSLTYSNVAGEVGLRRILNRLPQGTDITFLTHSRGAAVALSALFRPFYDTMIEVPPPDPLEGGRLGDIVLVAFAPAIGNGHMEQPDLWTHLDAMYVGFNANDPATSKKPLLGAGPSRRKFGDTGLGSSEAYFLDLQRQFGGGGRMPLQREVFRHGSHDWARYLKDARQADCLLWAGKVLVDKPAEGCAVFPLEQTDQSTVETATESRL